MASTTTLAPARSRACGEATMDRPSGFGARRVRDAGGQLDRPPPALHAYLASGKVAAARHKCRPCGRARRGSALITFGALCRPVDKSRDGIDGQVRLADETGGRTSGDHVFELFSGEGGEHQDNDSSAKQT